MGKHSRRGFRGEDKEDVGEVDFFSSTPLRNTHACKNLHHAVTSLIHFRIRSRSSKSLETERCYKGTTRILSWIQLFVTMNHLVEDVCSEERGTKSIDFKPLVHPGGNENHDSRVTTRVSHGRKLGEKIQSTRSVLKTKTWPRIRAGQRTDTESILLAISAERRERARSSTLVPLITLA